LDLIELVLKMLVNGQQATVTVNQKNALHSALPSALEQTGNLGQPPENWEIRTPDGTLLDPNARISAFGFGEGATLYANLRAGIGG